MSIWWIHSIYVRISYKDTYDTWQCRWQFRDNLLDRSMTTKKANAIGRNAFGINFALPNYFRVVSDFSISRSRVGYLFISFGRKALKNHKRKCQIVAVFLSALACFCWLILWLRNWEIDIPCLCRPGFCFLTKSGHDAKCHSHTRHKITEQPGNYFDLQLNGGMDYPLSIPISPISGKIWAKYGLN